MTRNAYNPGVNGQTNEFPDLEEQFSEDPARFLESNELMATARIAGIRDTDLLAAYERVAEQITTGSYRTTILEAIAERKADLGLETELADAPTPDTETPSQVAATDGGQELTFSENENTSEPTREPKGADVHPDTKGLEAGQVLVLERGDATEYIFPATEDAKTPYLLRTFDDQDNERTPEPIGLSFDEVASRLDGSLEPDDQADVPIDAPRTAATGGAD